ncbi:MAG TPA: hypothetical protein EYP87_04845 [Flavobacteriaceae bacterium]|nr:hypothetical protein [Flavobacteriaceae bacterium]
MKKIILLLIIIVLFSCEKKSTSATKNKEVKIEKIHNMDWLLGKWIRTNDKKRKQIYESWTKNSFTCKNKEIDFLNIIHYEKDGKNLKAYVSNNEMKIPFEFKRLNK